MPDDCVPWSTAWDDAAVGLDGFYRSRAGRAEDTFATQVTSGSMVAERIARIAHDTLKTLVSQHPIVTVTDVGAADGTLLTQLMSVVPKDLADALHWRGLDVRDRPDRLDTRVAWIAGDARVTAPTLDRTPGLVIAHEFLDDVACDVVEIDEDGRRRLVLVHPDGREVVGPRLDDLAACASRGVDGASLSAWCDRWWSRCEPAARIEVGAMRDDAWASIVRVVKGGLAIAVDYAHVASDRSTGLWDGGTLTGYRAGRLTSPVPDGTCNITAHLAIDACAAAVAATRTTLQPSGAGDDLWWLVQTMGR